jgi:hypothetical protein
VTLSFLIATLLYRVAAANARGVSDAAVAVAGVGGPPPPTRLRTFDVVGSGVTLQWDAFSSSSPAQQNFSPSYEVRQLSINASDGRREMVEMKSVAALRQVATFNAVRSGRFNSALFWRVNHFLHFLQTLNYLFNHARFRQSLRVCAIKHSHSSFFSFVPYPTRSTYAFAHQTVTLHSFLPSSLRSLSYQVPRTLLPCAPSRPPVACSAIQPGRLTSLLPRACRRRVRTA